MASKKNSEEERLLTAYLEGMKIIKKRLQKDGYAVKSTDSTTGSSCRCCMNLISSISHLRLDREAISTTLGLALVFGRVIHHAEGSCPTISSAILLPPPVKRFFPSVLSNLHLQRNNLEKIEGLEVLSNTLRVLSLAHNNISLLEESAPCLLKLRKLGLLDLSFNKMDKISIEPLLFPPSLIILDLRGNPVCRPNTYQEILLEKLPKLISLDGEDYNNDSEDDNMPPEHAAQKLSSIITSDASEMIQSTAAAIVERSRSRVEEMLQQMRTPRSQTIQLDDLKNDSLEKQ